MREWLALYTSKGTCTYSLMVLELLDEDDVYSYNV